LKINPTPRLQSIPPDYNLIDSAGFIQYHLGHGARMD
jgi:hypothetical protein